MSMRMEVGIDIVSVDRVKSMLDRHWGRLMETVFSKHDLKDFSDCGKASVLDRPMLDDHLAQFLAMKFAAKEAAIKVICPPLSTDYELSDIIIEGCNNFIIRLSASLDDHVHRKGISKLTGHGACTGDYAMAIVLGENNEKSNNR